MNVYIWAHTTAVASSVLQPKMVISLPRIERREEEKTVRENYYTGWLLNQLNENRTISKLILKFWSDQPYYLLCILLLLHYKQSLHITLSMKRLSNT